MKNFIKKSSRILIAILLFILPLSACKKTDGDKISLNEVTHSVFYAPLYVAIENGYFKEENMTVTLTNGGGADKVMTAVLSKNADIGLMGPETVIYVKSQGKTDCPAVIGQLTRCDGAFLLSRKPEPDFKIEDLKGKNILAGRAGGVPAMSFEYILGELGLKNNVDYELNFGVQFNLMTAAFEGGTGDYCTMFEPTASEYQKSGKGYIVAAMGELSGEIPYTSFVALNSYCEKNEKQVKNFLKAIKKGLEYIKTHTDEEVAEVIKGQFVGTSVESLTASVKSYRGINAWAENLVPTETGFSRLQNIMEYAGELPKHIAFSELVTTKYLP